MCSEYVNYQKGTNLRDIEYYAAINAPAPIVGAKRVTSSKFLEDKPRLEGNPWHRMSDHPNTSNAGRTSKVGMFRTDFHPSAVTLDALIGKKTYLDKSLFIAEIFEDKPFLLITAPRRLGKTTALHTLKSFVQLDYDEKGVPTGKPIEATGKYALFNKKLFDDRTLKIMDRKDIVDAHFGKYPVIHLDFQCHEQMDSYSKVVEHCKKVLQKAYLEHDYLWEHGSGKLKKDEKDKCEQWCERIEDIKETDITQSLAELCGYLHKHFGKKVFILCDEYDSVIMNALFNVQGKRNVADKLEEALATATGKQKSELKQELFRLKAEELDRVTTFSNAILAYALKRAVEHVERAVIVGISHIVGIGISGLNNVASHAFLDRNLYSDYFGLTDTEVKELCARYPDNKILLEFFKQHYGGYTDREGKCHIYSTWSVLSCLDTQEKRGFFQETGSIKNLEAVFGIPSIRVKILQLVQMKSTNIKMKTKINLHDLKALQQEVLEPSMRDNDLPDLFLSFLLEQGYLTFDGKPGKGTGNCYNVSVKVPNGEIMEILVDNLKNYYTEICKFEEDHQNNCRASFHELLVNSGNGDCFKNAVHVFHEKLQLFLNETLSRGSCLKSNGAAVHVSICSIFLGTDYTYCTEFYPDKHSRLDLAIHKGKYGVIIEFAHGRPTSRDALQQVKAKNYDKLFKNKVLFPDPPNMVIFIGLSINDGKQISLSCQIKGSSDILYKGTIKQPAKRDKNTGKAALRRSKRNRKHPY